MPVTRRAVSLGLLASALPLPGRADAAGFPRWLAGFRGRAQGAGIAPRALAALDGASYLPNVIANDRKQAEVARSLGDYIASAASAQRIAAGQKWLQRHGRLLTQVARRSGVPAEIIVAIWGMESSYGGFRGTVPVLSALATLAYEGRRAALFEAELIAALRILQAGDITPERMLGSFAGAMGHTQFMPSTYLAHAVDATGDGRRDIWGDDPSDALASTAALLAANGWQKGLPWGIEVRLPDGIDLALTGRVHLRSPAEWTRLGVTLASGGALPQIGRSATILPAGPEGPVFLITQNFHVLKTYNFSDAYAIGVGHLADRIAGGGPIRSGYGKTPWGMSDAERKRLQQRLNTRGFDAGNPDGVIGEKGRAAIRAFERAQGMRETGVPSRALLARLE